MSKFSNMHVSVSISSANKSVDNKTQILPNKGRKFNRTKKINKIKKYHQRPLREYEAIRSRPNTRNLKSEANKLRSKSIRRLTPTITY